MVGDGLYFAVLALDSTPLLVCIQEFAYGIPLD